MSLCNITGILRDSGNNPMGATLTVTLDAPLLSGDSLLVRKPVSFTIPGTGVIDIDLEESETSQVTYFFEVKVGTDYVVPPFHAIVPNEATVNFWELYPVSAITDLLPAGLRRLAQIIATNPTYAEAVKGIRPEGAYNPSVFYSKGALVSFSGGSYLYVASTLAQGKNPTLFNGSVPGNPVFWQTIALKGDTNGLAPENDVYDDVTWDGNFLAPTKNSVRDALQLFARLDSPEFIGDPKVPTKGVGDATASIASTAHVKNSIDTRETALLASIAATYLTQSSAASTYLTQSNAASTYLTQSNAASTYAPRNNPTFTGTINGATAVFSGDVTGVTPADNDNDTSFATTAYVQNQTSLVQATSNGSSQSINNGTITIVTFGTETTDTHGQWNPSLGQSIFTCSRPGLYAVYAQAQATTGSGTVANLVQMFGLRLNGSDLIFQTPGFFNTGSWNSSTFLIRLANADTLRIIYYAQWTVVSGTPTHTLSADRLLHIVRVAL